MLKPIARKGCDYIGDKAKHHLYLFQLFEAKTESDIKRLAEDLISDKSKIESQGRGNIQKV